MLNRLFVIIFLIIVLGGPFIALIAITDGTQAFGQEMQQKSMCLLTGTGCGNGNVVVTLASRI
ncbi:MAG: sugar transporter [Roseibium sp.]